MRLAGTISVSVPIHPALKINFTVLQCITTKTANSVNTDQTAPEGSLIWAYTVGSGTPVPIVRVIKIKKNSFALEGAN